MDTKNWNMLVEQINRLNQRVRNLEQDQDIIGSSAQKRASVFKDTAGTYTEELHIVSKKIDELKKGIKNVTIEMNKLIDQLKDAVKTDDFEEVQNMVDKWNPEANITHYELNKTLQDRFE